MYTMYTVQVKEKAFDITLDPFMFFETFSKLRKKENFHNLIKGICINGTINIENSWLLGMCKESSALPKYHLLEIIYLGGIIPTTTSSLIFSTNGDIKVFVNFLFVYMIRQTYYMCVMVFNYNYYNMYINHQEAKPCNTRMLVVTLLLKLLSMQTYHICVFLLVLYKCLTVLCNHYMLIFYHVFTVGLLLISSI